MLGVKGGFDRANGTAPGLAVGGVHFQSSGRVYHAERMRCRKLRTSVRMVSDFCRMAMEESATLRADWSVASTAVAISAITWLICRVSLAVMSLLRLISAVAAFCCSTAAAMVLVVTSAVTLTQSGLLDRYWDGARGETFQTGTGQRTTATLTDGSVVTLDAESELRVVEMAAQRRLQLVRGHAFFQVAKDPVHPFLVEAAGKTVRAVGTKFDVRVDDKQAVTVTLVEGKVRVEQSRGWLKHEQRADMNAGAKLVARADQNWKLTQVDAASETSWLSGRLTFLGEPLGSAIAEVNRYSRQKIVFADGRVPDKEIVGVFAAGDIDGFVTAMQLNGIARVVERSDTEIKLAQP